MAVSGGWGEDATVSVCFQCVFLALVHVDSTDSMLLRLGHLLLLPGIIAIFTDIQILLLFLRCENIGFA